MADNGQTSQWLYHDFNITPTKGTTALSSSFHFNTWPLWHIYGWFLFCGVLWFLKKIFTQTWDKNQQVAVSKRYGKNGVQLQQCKLICTANVIPKQLLKFRSKQKWHRFLTQHKHGGANARIWCECLRGFTSKDLRRGTDSINNSYVFLFFALFFNIILLNVTRSCKKQHREICYSSWLKCSLFKELTNPDQDLQQTSGLRHKLLKWCHIHHNGDRKSSCESTCCSNKWKNREL